MEEKICQLVIDMLDGDSSKFGIEHRTSDYTSLIYCDNDFFRVKYTDRSKWISIRLAKEDRNENDERFVAQKNKGQLHWKANIHSIADIKLFEEELKNACVSAGGEKYTKREGNGSTITLGYDFNKGEIITK